MLLHSTNRIANNPLELEGASLVGIFGTGRNGSTLLMRLLDGSSGLWVYPIELNFFTALTPQGFLGKSKRRVEQLLGNSDPSFESWVKNQLSELKTDYVDKLLEPIHVTGNPWQAIPQEAQPDRLLEHKLSFFLNAVRDAYDERDMENCRPLSVFKSIEVTHLPRYADRFPGMRFIHIVRHPFSNYASLKRTDIVHKQKPFWFQGGDILRTQLEKRWIPHVQFILRKWSPGSERHFLIKYEDLCSKPEQVIHQVSRWLGVPPPADPTLQTVLGGRQLRELPSNPSQKGVKAPPRVVANMAKEFSYQDVLTDREKEFILIRTADLGRRLGYFNEEDVRRLPGRMALALKWLSPDKWELMNANSKLRLVRALIARRRYIYSRLLSSNKPLR